MKFIFTVLIAFLASSLASLAAPAPQGFIIFTDPPSDYAQGAEFTSYVQSNWRYSTMITTDGSQEQVQNSGIIGIVNYPTGQETETDALREIQIIQALERKCPQEEFRQRLQNAQLKWQSALAVGKETARANSVPNSTAAPSDETISFVTTDGAKYNQVKITSHDDAGITVETDSGIEHIAFERLPKELQAEFHYNPAKASTFLQNLAASQQALTDQARQGAKANQTNQITAGTVLPTKRIQITPGVEITEDQRRQIAAQQQADNAREATAQNALNTAFTKFWDSQEFNQEKFIEPENLVPVDGPTYRETIDFINGRLGAKGMQMDRGFVSIGFGEKSKKLMLKGQNPEYAIFDHIAVFDPLDISGEVRLLSRTQTYGGDTVTTYEVVITARDRKNAILHTGLWLDVRKQPELVQNSQNDLIVFETEDESDATKMMNAFANLLGLLGATKEAF